MAEKRAVKALSLLCLLLVFSLTSSPLTIDAQHERPPNLDSKPTTLEAASEIKTTMAATASRSSLNNLSVSNEPIQREINRGEDITLSTTSASTAATETGISPIGSELLSTEQGGAAVVALAPLPVGLSRSAGFLERIILAFKSPIGNVELLKLRTSSRTPLLESFMQTQQQLNCGPFDSQDSKSPNGRLQKGNAENSRQQQLTERLHVDQKFALEDTREMDKDDLLLQQQQRQQLQQLRKLQPKKRSVINSSQQQVSTGRLKCGESCFSPVVATNNYRPPDSFGSDNASEVF